MKRVLVVGAGWTGAVAARQLHDAGVDVTVFERSAVVGGHSRSETLHGVVYEPNGAHIFHTADAEVAVYVQSFGLRRPYEHKVLTEIYASEDDDRPELLSWPPQLDEVMALPQADVIARELSELPERPSGASFEAWVTSLMGPTLYELFIRGYTIKQWGIDPQELSARIAPKRVDFRRDGNRRLFLDPWEFYAPAGINSIIESILRPVRLVTGAELDLPGMQREFEKTSYDACILTCPLDAFLGVRGALQWRGVELRSSFVECDEYATITPAYVVNRPSMRVAYTRTVETKHATGQRVRGTVVSEEYPGSTARHYPVLTVDAVHESANEQFKQEIRAAVDVPVIFAGRLANYCYINQDQAIRQGMDAAGQLLKAR